MADANSFNVHDVVVRDDVDLRPATFGTPQTKVTFFVGAHGPFTLTYPKDQATATRIQGDIDHQVVILRQVAGGS